MLSTDKKSLAKIFFVLFVVRKLSIFIPENNVDVVLDNLPFDFFFFTRNHIDSVSIYIYCANNLEAPLATNSNVGYLTVSIDNKTILTLNIKNSNYIPKKNCLLNIECKYYLKPYCLKDAKRLLNNVLKPDKKSQKNSLEKVKNREIYLENNLNKIFEILKWPIPKDIPKIHPAQKPVALLKKLIETFTDPGDVVIDPCCGSGSTLRAACELGRNSYGFEIDRTFYQRAKDEMLVDYIK